MAVLMETLTAPEAGWQRIDDRDPHFSYTADAFNYMGYSYNYANTSMLTTWTNAGVSFSFKGTKIRVISTTGSLNCNDVRIKIDGVEEAFTMRKPLPFVAQAMVYEKTGLEDKVHQVTIMSSATASGDFILDAIDIDSTGYMTYVGQTLSTPETGWQRFDDTNGKLLYSAGWSKWTDASSSGGTFQATQTVGETLSFKFYGTKLRILSTINFDHSSNVSITIDGVTETYSDYRSAIKYKAVAYEKMGLALGVHTVVITCTEAKYVAVDAIDIDSTGYLVAQVGTILTAPEAGWRRYDDRAVGIVYTGTWTQAANTGEYSTTETFGNTIGSTISFRFYGTKVRLMANMTVDGVKSAPVLIDGVAYTFGHYKAGLGATDRQQQSVVFEKLDLPLGVHQVVMKVPDAGGYIGLDAVDIDSTGILGYIPATKGKLCTKVSDMQIGDFIVINYNRTAAGYGWNDTTVPEMALTGAVSGDTMKYGFLVKVAKGLLMADRVFANTLTWDTLNSVRWIEGVRWGVNAVPAMTSNTSGSVTVSASSSIVGVNDPWKAFDGDIATASSCWAPVAGTKTGWLKVDFGSQKTLSGYSLYPQVGWPARMPSVWTFEGSNTGAFAGEQTILDTRTYPNWSVMRHHFAIKNPESFRYYRINVTANAGDATYLAIGEMQLYETMGTLRAPTGGCAYRDANGNYIATNPGLGGWPTMNEWDTYVVNFPTNLIQSGATLDDVFHWNSGSTTWCKETPVTGINRGDAYLAANTMRVARGGWTNAQNMTYHLTTYNGTSAGWRPAFEYREV